MFIYLKTIQSILNNYKTTLISDDKIHAVSSYSNGPVISCPLSEHLLYIVTEEDNYEKLSGDPAIHILVCLGKKQIKDFCFATPYVLYVHTGDTISVITLIRNFFNKRTAIGEFSNSLLEILFYEGGIQAMLDKIYPAFENPIAVFDTGFRLIAANWEELKKTEHGSRLVQNNGFTDAEFKLINQPQSMWKHIQKSETPIEVFHPEIGCSQLICNINTNRRMGHIVINAVNRPFDDIDRQLIIFLKEAIDQQMKKDEFVRNNRGFPYEYYIRDLLDEKIAASVSSYDCQNYIGKEFQGNMYCLVIETAKSSHTLNSLHIRHTFEIHFPSCKTLMNQGEIIVIFILPAEQIISQYTILKISDICKTEKIYAGLSNYFHHITHIRDYYYQALRAIELGTNENDHPGLYIYEKYSRKHLMNIFTQKESCCTFLSPKLKLLMDYDNAHNTRLSQILYWYLVHERNIGSTAAYMNIHRNTLTYHIRKISSIVSVNYDDYNERQYILLSYELYKMITEKKNLRE